MLRFRCPVAWTPETHGDFPVAFVSGARVLLCAEADARRGGGGGGEGLSLGDLPREVLLRALGMAAVPLSAWIGVGEDEDAGEADVAERTDSRKTRVGAGRDPATRTRRDAACANIKDETRRFGCYACVVPRDAFVRSCSSFVDRSSVVAADCHRRKIQSALSFNLHSSRFATPYASNHHTPRMEYPTKTT